MRSSLILGILVFGFIFDCVAQSNITIVGATMGLGSAGSNELSRFKSSSLRKKLLDAIDSGQMGVNDWVPADTNDAQHLITALCAATLTGNVQTIEELFKRGANPNMSCVSGGRPFVLDVIVQKDRKTAWNPDETIAVLLSHGAKLNKPENQAILARRLAEIQAEAEKAREDARQSAVNRQGLLAIAGAVAIGAATSGPNYSNEQRTKLVDAFVQDRMNAAAGVHTNNFGVAADSAQSQVTRNPTLDAEHSRKSPSLEIASANESWRQCGPEKRCLIGDGLTGFCSGPYDSNKTMCKSECSMDSLAFYHDTTLKPGTYVPGAGKCSKGSCNVVNSCD